MREEREGDIKEKEVETEEETGRHARDCNRDRTQTEITRDK